MLRLFLGIGPDDSSRERLAELVSCAADNIQCDRLRWIPVANYHITLIFLGDIASDRVDTITDATAQLCADTEPFSLTVNRLSVFPESAHPRVMAMLATPAPALEELQAKISQSLHRRGFQFSKRPYRPHMTVARVRGRSALELELPVIEPLNFDVATLTLYQSIRREDGVRYEVLNKYPLSGSS